MEKLTKENIYIDLRGKSKEELTDLWEFLNGVSERVYAPNLHYFLEYSDKKDNVFHYNSGGHWMNPLKEYVRDKTEVTIEQLKEILQPTKTLQQQLQKVEAEVKRLRSLIEEENKPKVGDWAMLWEDDEETPVFGLITDVTDFYLTCNGSWENGRKITNKQLIELLENESRIIKE